MGPNLVFWVRFADPSCHMHFFEFYSGKKINYSNNRNRCLRPRTANGSVFATQSVAFGVWTRFRTLAHEIKKRKHITKSDYAIYDHRTSLSTTSHFQCYHLRAFQFIMHEVRYLIRRAVSNKKFFQEKRIVQRPNWHSEPFLR